MLIKAPSSNDSIKILWPQRPNTGSPDEPGSRLVQAHQREKLMFLVELKNCFNFSKNANMVFV